MLTVKKLIATATQQTARPARHSSGLNIPGRSPPTGATLLNTKPAAIPKSSAYSITQMFRMLHSNM